MKGNIKKWTSKIKHKITRIIRLVTLPLIRLSQRIFLPGFKGASLYEVSLFFIHGMKKSSISVRANSISYSFIIAFIPAVLFLFTLIPYIPIANVKENILLALQEIIPNDAFILLRSTIEDIISHQRTGLLSLSFLFSLFSASNGIIAIMTAFNQTAHAIETRPLLKKYLISFLLVFILAVNMIVSGAALALSSVILYFIEGEGLIGNTFTMLLIQVGQWAIIFLTSLIGFSSIYYLAPAQKRVFPFFSAGSIMASFLSVVTFKVFSIFINHFSNYNKFYGSLGTTIMIMVWINLTALMLLIGFEVNASIYAASKNGGSKKPQGK